ncbi:hypothetical protein C5167_039153 [Papaver somniferum]|uniref:Uncharacterized protein n=2 Tax=Papaver somniferum TaxID=3469 RepID=A0A4Y7IFL0_PAPSO|nr:hypothetical protein C5167_039153 [Papaver somniferum]
MVKVFDMMLHDFVEESLKLPSPPTVQAVFQWVFKEITERLIVVTMNKLLDFGRKAVFFVRVMSGYEERSIKAFRLKLQKQIQEANEKKACLKKIPERVILSEVRRMVEEMQALNNKLEETETAIEDFLKPIDNQAELIMNMQLEGEESRMKAMQEQALMENDAAIAAAKEKLTAHTSVANAADVAAAKEKLTGKLSSMDVADAADIDSNKEPLKSVNQV